MMKIKDREKCFLAGICYMGPATVSRLYSFFGDFEHIYSADRGKLGRVMSVGLCERFINHRDKYNPDTYCEYVEGLDIGFAGIDEDEYPEKLKNINGAPIGIFYKGKLPERKELHVAVIGARECSEYGKYIATELGESLARNGIPVISGMARGVDGISQRGALSAGGSSYGILGSGVDVCYPACNRELYEELTKKGGVLSDFPPGTEPLSKHFPQRNRIVSGLSDAVVVIEARQKSGTLITVDMALEQGRDVYVVPGRITDRLSDGCNRLLSQGASVFLSPDEFIKELLEKKLKELSCEKGKRVKRGYEKNKRLPTELKAVYKALDFNPKSIDEIKRDSGEEGEMSVIMSKLMELCIQGFAVQLTQDKFSRKM